MNFCLDFTQGKSLPPGSKSLCEIPFSQTEQSIIYNFIVCIYHIINVGFCGTPECKVFLSGFIIMILICIFLLVMYVLNKKYEFLNCDNDNCIRRCCN